LLQVIEDKMYEDRYLTEIKRGEFKMVDLKKNGSNSFEVRVLALLV